MAEPKILVVDDEKSIVEAVRYSLERAGFRVAAVSDGEEALERCRAEAPDLMILDLMLPGLDGLEVCRILRGDNATRGIPIIMLTVKGQETDKIVGLELGADDYMTKPFSPRELVARVRAILRRTEGEPPREVFQLDELRVDWGKYIVSVGGAAVELTSKEFDLLKALIEAKGRALTRDRLLERVWGYDRSLEIETRTVDLHISQLRRKLSSASARIRTVKNVGYRFVIDE